jgi:hypothetical protein
VIKSHAQKQLQGAKQAQPSRLALRLSSHPTVDFDHYAGETARSSRNRSDLFCGRRNLDAHRHRSEARDEASHMAHLTAEHTYDDGCLNKYFMSAKSILKTAEPSSSHIIVEQSYLMFVPRRCSWRISCCETM